MARKSLRPQLNQIRAWVRQGRTDAWIAHQLEVTTDQLSEFRSRHGLSPEDEDPATGEVDLRDEIEAEIEAAEQEEAERDQGAEKEKPRGRGKKPDDADEEKPRRRRRRRRGGRGRRRRAGAGMEATFEHGEKDGYGLWLDEAIKDDPIYAEHWAGHKELKVTVEPDRIVLERGGKDAKKAGSDGSKED